MARMMAGMFALLAFSGCAIQAPTYQASVESVEALRRAGLAPLRVSEASADPSLSTATAISLRGNSMSSPVGSGYADYLAAALRQELELAKLLDAGSRTDVTGVLLKNDISAGGISTNSGEIAANFTVRRDGVVRYQAVKSATMSWESGFAAAVAIPAAQQSYPQLVQRLLSSLFSDPAFLDACR
jgi:hypothetical protein